MTLVVIDSSVAIEFYIEPPEGAESISYFDHSGEQVPLACLGGPSIPVAIVNPEGWECCCMPEANESLTWSTEKPSTGNRPQIYK